jgi:hypothetical protein
MEIETPTVRDENEEVPFIHLQGIHKTYLLGIEGVAALRFLPLLIFSPLHYPLLFLPFFKEVLILRLNVENSS